MENNDIHRRGWHLVEPSRNGPGIPLEAQTALAASLVARLLVNALKNPPLARGGAAGVASLVATVASALAGVLGAVALLAFAVGVEVSGSSISVESRWSSESVSFEGGVVVIRSIDV